jgi:hypothetical protein
MAGGRLIMTESQDHLCLDNYRPQISWVEVRKQTGSIGGRMGRSSKGALGIIQDPGHRKSEADFQYYAYEARVAVFM